ncbi:MAG: CoA transferase [Gemmatimonadota bacterium]
MLLDVAARRRLSSARSFSHPQEFQLPRRSRPEPAGALVGVRVLDLSRVLAGPLCTMMLGDLGADVIKIERPDGGDETRQWGPPWVKGENGRESAYYLAINRNKRSVTADLSTPEGRRLVRDLAGTADVVVENFAPGTLEKWNLDYEALSADNPGLVLCSISGFGSDGPDAVRPGYDFAIQARAGWMAITGDPAGEPMKVGVALVDVLSGQNAATAILAALMARSRTGRGQKIGVSLLDSAVAGLVNVGQAALAGVPARRFGNAHPTIVPYQAFPTRSRPIVVAVGNDRQWRRFCNVLRLEDLVDDPRFATNPGRVDNREELIPILRERLATDAAEAWLAALSAAGVPCEPINLAEEAVRDPAIVQREGLWPMAGDTFGTVESVASPLRLAETPPTLRRPPPALGEHTEDVKVGGW